MAEAITVVGGGVIGLVTAFELTERDQRVRVYDPTPGERGTGASYFAGGMLAPIAEVQFQQDALFPLMVASADAYPSLMRRLSAVTDAPTGYDTTGTLVVAGDRADAAHLPPLILRTRRAGDYLRLPVGQKKLKKILIDDRVPQEQRNRMPLIAVAGGSEILWIVGGRRSILAPLTEETGEIVEIKCVKETIAT